MSAFSPMLDYFVSRMQGLSTNVFRLEAQNQTANITPQSIIRFTLPSNSLVQMDSFSFHFNAQTTSGAATTVSARLPDDISKLVNRVEVSIGGVSVASGANFYNVLSAAKRVIDGDHLDGGMNHPEIIPSTAGDNYVDGTLLAREEAPSSLNGAAQFCINKWHGFIGECKPEILDLSLVNDVVITIYLEQPSLCTTLSDNITSGGFITSGTLGAAVPNYILNNIYATVKVFSLASGFYDSMVAEQMSSTGELEVPFKQYFSFRDQCTGSTRFNVATQSLDRIFVAHHAVVSPAGGTLHPVLASGYAAIGDTQARLMKLGKMKYIHPYTRFREPTAAAGTKILQEFQLNGAKYPQFRATSEDMYEILRNSSNRGKHNERNTGLQQYKSDDYVCAMKLTMDAPNARYIQGLDSRSVSLNGYYNIFNLATTSDLTLFCECTSSLLISSGRQVAVIQ